MSYFNGKKIADLLSMPELKPLESELEIEELLVAIKSMEEKIEFFENLKRKRASDIEQEISKIKSKIDILKYVITATMEERKSKSLNFPSTGKVTITERKGKWVVDDENALLDMLSKELDENDYKKLVQSKATYSKKEVDAYLDQWEKGGKVPPCVHRESPTKPLKLAYTGDEVVSYDEDEMELNISKVKQGCDPGPQGVEVPSGETKSTEENFDGLTF